MGEVSSGHRRGRDRQPGRPAARRSGDHVSVVSRRGSGPAGVTHLAADAADAAAMDRLAAGPP